MPFHLPDLADESLIKVSVCAHISGVRDTTQLHNCAVESTYKSGSELIWVRLRVDRYEDTSDYHFHFDLSKTEFASGDFQRINADEIIRNAEAFFGELASACIVAEYLIELGELPDLGIVTSLYGMRTEACGSQMSLTGAMMEVEDGDPFTRVRWNVYDDAELNVLLDAEGEWVIGPNYLTDIVGIMRSGLSCYIFESSEKDSSIKHATKGKKSMPPAKRLGP